MPLISCPECNKQISNQAKSCPSCGFPLEVIENSIEEANDISRNESEITEPPPLIHWKEYQDKYCYVKVDIEKFIDSGRLKGSTESTGLYVADMPPKKLAKAYEFEREFHTNTNTNTNTNTGAGAGAGANKATIADGMRIGTGIIIVIVALLALIMIFFGGR